MEGAVKRFSWMWVACFMCAVSATGCGLVLDTQARDGSGSDAGTGRRDIGGLECTEASECDDFNVCNGIEQCVDNHCVGTDAILDCDDGVTCTSDQCDPAMGCLNVPSDAVCPDRQYCDVVADCQPLPSCDDASDCNLGDPCAGPVTCEDNMCVRGAPVVCPLQGQCLVGTCVLGACVYAPSSARCNTDADSCAVSTCSPNGTCSQPVPSNALCNDGIACTTDICTTAGQVNAPRCQHVPNHQFCEDGVDCTVNLCAPDDPTADLLGDGCAMRLNDDICQDSADLGECVKAICLPSGCDDGRELDRCPEGGACDIRTGYCEYSEGCPNNCLDYGSPCAPAVCIDNECVTVQTDPCVAIADCAIGYCDVSGAVPRCAVRPDPTCLPVIVVGTAP